jgi:hypothetical protein
MYKIQYGKPTNKRKRIIGKAKDIEKANIIVYDFIERIHPNHLYTRWTKINDKVTKVDYGNHENFIYITEV